MASRASRLLRVFSSSRVGFIWAAIVVFYLSGTSAYAQTSQITGVVRDSSGAAVPNSSIRLTRMDTGTVTTVTSNDVGAYVIPYLSPATYSVEATAAGLAPTTVSAVIRTGQVLQLDISLKVAAVSETVDVVDSRLMEKESGAADTEIDRTLAASLPLNGRAFNSLLLLTPGIVPSSSGYSVNGSRENTNQWIVDGVSANFGAYNTATLAGSAGGGYAPLSATGGTNTLLSTDALEEFQVQTSSYAPEYGRSAGGQIQLTTKSGTETFHGTLFDFVRNNYFDANNWFNDRNGIKQPVTRQNDFGGTVGGPIFPHKTFFFFSFEGLRLDQPATVNGFVPSRALRASAPAAVQPMLNTFPLPTGPDLASGLGTYVAPFAQTNNVNATSVRIDHHFSDRLTLFGRYLHAPSASTAPSSLSNLVTTSYGTDQGMSGLTWTATSSLANDLRVSYATASADAEIQPLAVNGAVIPPYSTFFPGHNPATDYESESLSFGSSTILLWGHNAGNEQRAINITDSLTYVKGNHTLKFGFDYRHLTPTRRPAQSNYAATFTSLASIRNAVADSQTVKNSAAVRLYFNQYAGYVEDTWRVTAPLVLTYGLRWDLAPPPVFTEGPALLAVNQVTDPSQMAIVPNAPIYSTDHHDFAPRFGFAYDLRRGQRLDTVLRGGVGLFWDVEPASVGNTLGSTPPSSNTNTFANLSYPLPVAQQVPPPIILTPPFSTFSAFDPHLPTPHILQYNFAIEQQISAAQTLNINYIGSSGHNLPRQGALGNVSSSFLLETLFNLNNSVSNYNALQVKFQRRLSHGLQFLTQYTWAKSLDDVSTENGTLWTVPVKGYLPQQDYGPSGFDIRHQFSFGGTYTTNADELGRVPGLLLSGWSLDPLVRFQSALPVNVYYATTISGVSLYSVRPDLVTSQPLYLYGPQYPGGRALNPAALATFTTASTTFDTLRQGTLPRNFARGFNLFEPDMSIGRRFPVRESAGLEMRMEVFNVFNHPNFGEPANGQVFNAAGFGVSTSSYNSASSGFTTPIGLYQVGGPRSMQLSLKLVF